MFKNEQEATLWAAFATGAIQGRNSKQAAKEADALLEEWRKRDPREDEKPADDAGAEDKSPEPAG